MSSGPLLSVRNLNVSFGAAQVLKGIDFDVPRGSVLGIVGESGAGKSMAMRGVLDAVLGGQRIADKVEFGGVDLLSASKETMRLIRNRKIGFVAQDARAVLNPFQRIERSLHEILTATGNLPKEEARDRSLAMLRAVRLADPENVLRRYPHEISGGMAQRVLIAAALLNSPELIIADEATTGLDPSVEVQILDLLMERITEQGAAAILVTHEIGIVRHYCTDVLVLYGGRVVERGPVASVLTQPAHPYTAMLLNAHRTAGPATAPMLQAPSAGEGCAFANRCEQAATFCFSGPIPVQRDDVRLSRCRLAIDELARSQPVALPTAARSSPAVPVGPPPGDDWILEVDNLRKAFVPRAAGPTVHALNGVDLRIAPGETLALVGESGAGKSTIGRCILKLLDADAGRIILAGDDVTFEPRNVFRHRRRLIQTVFQDPSTSIDPRLTALEVVMEPLAVFRPELSREESTRAVLSLFDAVGLGPHLAGRRAHQLSGGQKQRLAIARALAPEPRLIVLDEPTASLDMSIRGQILALLERLQAERGLAYLLISHDMASVARLAHRAAVMYLGEIVEEGPAKKVLQAPRHPYAIALARSVLSASLDGPLPEGERLRGENPKPTALPPGCFFASRCPHRVDACEASHPTLRDLDGDRRARCHRLDELQPGRVDAGRSAQPREGAVAARR